MKIITEAPDLKGKRVLVRVDWNISQRNQFKVDASKPTLEYLLKAGCQLTLITHCHKIEELKQFVPSGATLLPNLRENPGEEQNDEAFAKVLAKDHDLFVNEAFSVSHRNHASIVSLPKLLPSYAGLRFVEEVEKLSIAFNPPHPSLFIIGGAKIETKLPLIERFLKIADEIFVTGLIAKPFSKTELSKNPKVSYPHGDIRALDVDDETLKNCKLKIENSKFILWNGPVGKYEDGFKKGTFAIAQMIAESGKQSIVGGGDTVAAIQELNLLDKFSFVSTGGGAMLEFLATGTLPGIKALA